MTIVYRTVVYRTVVYMTVVYMTVVYMTVVYRTVVYMTVVYRTVVYRISHRKKAAIFRHVREIAESDCWLRHVRPSVRLHGSTRLPLDGFALNLVLNYSFQF